MKLKKISKNRICPDFIFNKFLFRGKQFVFFLRQIINKILDGKPSGVMGLPAEWTCIEMICSTICVRNLPKWTKFHKQQFRKNLLISLEKRILPLDFSSPPTECIAISDPARVSVWFNRCWPLSPHDGLRTRGI